MTYYPYLPELYGVNKKAWMSVLSNKEKTWMSWLCNKEEISLGVKGGFILYVFPKNNKIIGKSLS